MSTKSIKFIQFPYLSVLEVKGKIPEKDQFWYGLHWGSVGKRVQVPVQEFRPRQVGCPVFAAMPNNLCIRSIFQIS